VLVNAGLAVLIVGAIGATTFAPPWVGGALLLVGAVTTVVAVSLWRAYLHRAQTTAR
jgi:hypothetical protein